MWLAICFLEFYKIGERVEMQMLCLLRVSICLVTLLHEGTAVWVLANQVWPVLYISPLLPENPESHIVPLDVSVLIIIPFIISLMPTMRCTLVVAEPRCRTRPHSSGRLSSHLANHLFLWSRRLFASSLSAKIIFFQLFIYTPKARFIRHLYLISFIHDSLELTVHIISAYYTGYNHINWAYERREKTRRER